MQHIEYVPFGEVFIEERNNKWNTPFLFNAKELYEETGLYYYGARYYDPRTSIWISTDPLQEKHPNISTYAYTFQNPVKFIDPTGMEAESSDGDKSPKIDLDFKGVLGKAKDDFLRMVGLHPDQVNPENVNASSRETLEAARKTHEEGKERRKATLETIDSANETMLFLVPFGGVGYSLYRDKEVTAGSVGLEIVGIIPLGKIVGKTGKFVKILVKEDDIMIFSAKFGDEVVEGISNFIVKDKKLYLDKLHLQGSEGGKVGISNLFEMARDLGHQYNIEEVIIQGGKRTTGQYKETTPSPITIKID